MTYQPLQSEDATLKTAMDSDKTPWFPPSIKPARIGVYETRWADKEMRASITQYQHWDGEGWGGWASDLWHAEQNARSRSMRQEPEWRGLVRAAASLSDQVGRTQ